MCLNQELRSTGAGYWGTLWNFHPWRLLRLSKWGVGWLIWSSVGDCPVWIEKLGSWTSSQPACHGIYGKDHKRGRGASTASGDECVCTSCPSAECQVLVNQPFSHSQLLSETASGLSLEEFVAPLPWVTAFGSQNAPVTRIQTVFLTAAGEVEHTGCLLCCVFCK